MMVVGKKEALFEGIIISKDTTKEKTFLLSCLR